MTKEFQAVDGNPGRRHERVHGCALTNPAGRDRRSGLRCKWQLASFAQSRRAAACVALRMAASSSRYDVFSGTGRCEPGSCHSVLSFRRPSPVILAGS
jgi:hypothetical protein